MAVVHKSSWGQFVVVFTGRPIAAYVTLSRPRPPHPTLHPAQCLYSGMRQPHSCLHPLPREPVIASLPTHTRCVHSSCPPPP